VLDRSQEAFTVPEDGNNFYVDDHSNVNDEYTPNGIGDNRHTGKISSAPKPYATNLLRVYSLSTGAHLFVDTGSYSMIDPVAVSGSVNLGLGLDQGFTITGPTNTALVAELFPAIPGDRTRALIELNDADGVAVEHLTLRDAQRGLYVHDGSDNVSARNIIAFGHLLDGVLVDTNAPTADFVALTAHDNGGRGIDIDGPIHSLSGSVAFNNTLGGIRLNGAISEVRGMALATTAVWASKFTIRAQHSSKGNASFRNDQGMLIDNTAGARPALVGSTDLVLANENLFFSNKLNGITALHNVVVAGNT
jgi:hypothetical protein